MNDITVYNFSKNELRTEAKDGQVWFCLADCMSALELKTKTTKMRLAENGVRKTYLIDSMGREQSAVFINEPNLYRLIFRSNKPQAQAFADWVYNEVLPSIRKTGSYGVPALTEDKAVMKAIGGLVKKCCAVVVRDELNKILNPEKTEHWEVNDNDLILQLHRWHATLNKSETLEFRRLHAENDLLKQRLEEVKKLLA